MSMRAIEYLSELFGRPVQLARFPDPKKAAEIAAEARRVLTIGQKAAGSNPAQGGRLPTMKPSHSPTSMPADRRKQLLDASAIGRAAMKASAGSISDTAPQASPGRPSWLAKASQSNNPEAPTVRIQKLSERRDLNKPIRFADNAAAMPAGDDTNDSDDIMADDRRQELLSKSPAGRAVLDSQPDDQDGADSPEALDAKLATFLRVSPESLAQLPVELKQQLLAVLQGAAPTGPDAQAGAQKAPPSAAFSEDKSIPLHSPRPDAARLARLMSMSPLGAAAARRK
jgi:hypothetical protein